MPLFCHYYVRVFSFYKLSITKFLLILFSISSVWGIIRGSNNITNVILSWWICVPIVVLFTLKSKKCYDSQMIHEFMQKCAITTIIINAFGLLFFISTGGGDDSYSSAYGQHFKGCHGLASINAILFFYYLSHIIKEGVDKRNIIFSFIFFVNFILCFFGLSLFVLLLSIVIISLNKIKFKFVILLLLFFISAYYVIKKVNPNNLSYIENYVTIAGALRETDDIPRKLLFFNTAMKRYAEEDIMYKVLGFGPGSYNSRVAFLINKDSNNPFTALLGHSMPYYHTKDVFVYWNKENVVENMDGTANQPFSSLIALLMENGLPFTIIFMIYWIKNMFHYGSLYKNDPISFFFYLTNIYMIISFSVDQWLESTEFIFFCFLCIICRSYIDGKTTELKFKTSYDLD